MLEDRKAERQKDKNRKRHMEIFKEVMADKQAEWQNTGRDKNTKEK